MKKQLIIGCYLILSCAVFCQQNITTYRTYSKAKYINVYTRVSPPELFLQREALGLEATTSFVVNFEGSWTAQQMDAFNYAVNIYSQLISSSQPIKIKAEFTSLSTGTLASTEVAYFYNNFSTVTSNTQHPIALAKAIDPNLVYNGEYDLSIEFNSTEDYYFGIDGVPNENKFDFVSVAMHEIGHGLGIWGTMWVDNGNGSWGMTGYPNNTQGIYPDVFDRFGVHGTTKLLDVTNSATLGTYLTSNNVFFNGMNARKANNNNNPKLYAPSEWDEGSSFAHLDEDVFPEGNINTLYTPELAYAEVIHTPGPVGLGMLKDLGWALNRYVYFINPSYEITTITKGQDYTIKWYDNTQSTLESVRIKLYKMINGEPFYLMHICDNASINGTNNQYVWHVPITLENEYYRFTVEDPYTGNFLGTSAVFYISDIPAQPVFTPAGTHFSSAQYIRLSSPTQGVVIRYTKDNSEPGQTSAVYNDNNPIYIDQTTTIKAKAFLTLANGNTLMSYLSDKTYYINADVLSTVISGRNTYVFYRNNPASWGGGTLNDNWLKLGRKNNSNGYDKYRSYISWENIAQAIPRYSIITAVELLQTFNPTNTNTSIEFRHMDNISGCDVGCIYNKCGNGDAFSMQSGQQNVFHLEGLKAKIQQIVDNNGGTLYLGLKNSNEDDIDNYVDAITTQSTLRIYFKANVTIIQLDKNDNPFGQVSTWENNNHWYGRDVPFSLYVNPNPPNNSLLLKSFQERTTSNEKYWKWLDQSDIQNFRTFTVQAGENTFKAKFNEIHNGITINNLMEGVETLNPDNDNIKFSDPWFIDLEESLYGQRNRGMSNAEWRTRSSPFNPDYNTIFNNGTDPSQSYKGVFLDQNSTFDPTLPNYSVQAISPQDIPIQHSINPPLTLNHRFYFQNWSRDFINGQPSAEFQDSMALQTGVVFKNENAVVKANMKGTQLSSQTDAFENSSQRKFIRSSNGHLHMVYESMGKVWYEVSTDGGSSWNLMNEGLPLNSGAAKSPSIDYFGNNIVIVYQQQETNGYSIKVSYYGYNGNNSYNHTNTATIAYEYDEYYVTDSHPVIAYGYDARAIVCWKTNAALDEHLKCRALGMGYGEITLYGMTSFGDANSTTPTIVTDKNSQSINYFNLAWCQENPSNGNSEIYYYDLSIDGNNILKRTASPEIPSQNCGYPKNYKPSITYLLQSNGQNAKLAWIGERNDEEGEEELRKSAAGSVQKILSLRVVMERLGIITLGHLVIMFKA